jgi:hypothetical protein
MTGYSYRAEIDTSLGLRVVRQDHDNEWPPEEVFWLTPATGETDINDLLTHNDANLEGAGWRRCDGAVWAWSGRGRTNGMVYASDVERIEHDGRYCGCPPGEHGHALVGPHAEGGKSIAPPRSLLVVEGPGDMGRQELWATGKPFVRAPIRDDTVCDGCERDDVPLWIFTWPVHGGEYELILCAPCSQKTEDADG